MAGTLATMNAVENSFISTSMPLAVIDGADQMKVVVSVSEALVPKLATGDTAEVYVSAIDTAFEAVIRSVERAANMQTKLYTVVLTVPAEVGGLLSGMFADVTFYTDSQDNVVLVPTEAIQTGTSGQHVFILDEQDIAHMIPVQTGLVGDGITEITSGLSGGERLVTVGQFYLKDGSQVRVVSAEV
jgi:RND family efflux transporter MFP subunit